MQLLLAKQTLIPIIPSKLTFILPFLHYIMAGYTRRRLVMPDFCSPNLNKNKLKLKK